MATSYDPPSWAGKPLGGLHLDVLKVRFELVLLIVISGIGVRLSERFLDPPSPLFNYLP